jgi:DNA/RNA endonuclease YhcR with UshA esterase domain
MEYSARKGIMRLALAACVGLAACAQIVPVREVIDHPREYVGETVTIEGNVAAVYSLIIIKYFELNDGTGTIGVVSSKPLPRKGEHLSVTGRLEEAFSLGDRSMTVLIERGANLGIIGVQ